MSILENWLAEIETWVNTPFVTEGCEKGKGVTCAHWVIDAMLKAIPNSESIAYAMRMTHRQYYIQNVDIMPEVMDHIAFRTTWEKIQPGDVAFSRVRRVASTPAIYFGNNVFVYCDTSQRLIVKQALLGNLIERIMYVFRFYAIEEESKCLS